MTKIDINQTITIGANIKATLWVPECCNAKRPINMAQGNNSTSPTKGNSINDKKKKPVRI